MNPFRSLIKINTTTTTTPQTHPFQDKLYTCVACNTQFLDGWYSKLCNGNGARFGLWPFRFLFGKRCYAETWEHIHIKCSKCSYQWLMRSARAERCWTKSKQITNSTINENEMNQSPWSPTKLKLLEVPTGALDNVR